MVSETRLATVLFDSVVAKLDSHQWWSILGDSILAMVFSEIQISFFSSCASRQQSCLAYPCPGGARMPWGLGCVSCGRAWYVADRLLPVLRRRSISSSSLWRRTKHEAVNGKPATWHRRESLVRVFDLFCYHNKERKQQIYWLFYRCLLVLICIGFGYRIVNPIGCWPSKKQYGNKRSQKLWSVLYIFFLFYLDYLFESRERSI
jgi:hypothetical protein